MTARLKDMKNLDNDARAALNAEVAAMRDAFKAAQEELENTAMLVALAEQKLDAADTSHQYQPPVTNGKLHPLTQTMSEIAAIFESMGYGLRTGPDIEDDWHNFGALNFPEHHPARDMHDTFFVDGGNLLRTHTSPVQIRSMESDGVPIKIFCPGATYRTEMDATHFPMFHQVEGLHIDKNVTMSDLISDVKIFLARFFEMDSVDLRVRPSYFPFTEPSIEIDIKWRGDKWLEIMGAGMVHPNVLKNVGVNPDEFQGFAFGAGIDRLTMLKYGYNDGRKLFEGDIRWIKAKGF
ncbi:MAG: phenylalanine--tRNA ligase subunit alpha [Alphaproteobacteria bacterium]|nr:phenylalanine--tRNA ligase subunit alpha [Alphaproteobacteria bacterium]MCL2889643.1 phenylalanine--tRNA ligase subunit alpha [Alphaproteobacteria bacterium]